MFLIMSQVMGLFGSFAMVASTALPSMVVQWDNPLNLEHVGVQRELWIVTGP